MQSTAHKTCGFLLLLGGFWRTIWRTSTDHLHLLAKVIWSDNQQQVLMRKTAALLALLLTAPVQGIAAERAPYPPGSGWIHLFSKCSIGGTYCPEPYKVDVGIRENNYRMSYWARGAGKRGKITYVETIRTIVGPDWMSPPEPYMWAVNCEMWERKALFGTKPWEWDTITPRTRIDAAALLVCD